MSADDMTPDEVASFSEFVAGTVVSSWAHAADARTADLAALWAAGADQGWFELGTADALAAALAHMRELGRVACPLPVIDGFAAARLLRGEDKLAHQLAAGELGVLVTSGTSQGRNEDQSGVGPGYLDAAVAATPRARAAPTRRAGPAVPDHGPPGATRRPHRPRPRPAAVRPPATPRITTEEERCLPRSPLSG